MTCKECIHEKVCCDWVQEIGIPFVNAEQCEHFKPKSRFIELPCEVGQTVYDVYEFFDGTDCPEMYELKDNEIHIEKDKNGNYIFTYDGMYIYPEEIGRTYFYTKEEAEQFATDTKVAYKTKEKE